MVAAVAGCQTTTESLLPEAALTWDEIAASRAYLSSNASNSSVPAGLRLASLEVHNDNNRLVTWVKQLKIERPRSYENGVYGKVGNATVYIAPASRVPDDRRLYWIMVKVLSEKYGCFITEKKNHSALVAVSCRDQRRVTFRRSRGDGWVMFYGRQYDRDGREIIIERN